jgi:hypothetical protein
MTSIRTKIGTGVTLAALGGLTAYAFASSPTDASPSAPAAAPVEVRTQIERHTIHKTKRLKPKPAAAGVASGPGPAAAPAGSSGPSASAGPGPAPAQAAAPARAAAPPARDPSGHDVGDDHGGRGELEPRDDHGGGDAEPGDDHGSSSGHGGGGDDD